MTMWQINSWKSVRSFSGYACHGEFAGGILAVPPCGKEPQHIVDKTKNYTRNSGFMVESSSAFEIKNASRLAVAIEVVVGRLPMPDVTRLPNRCCLGLIAALCALAMHSIVFAAEIKVSAAASLTDVLQVIGGDYEKETGDKIVFNFAGSSTLARQIEEGAPADVFFSADEAKMDTLEKRGLIAPGTRKSLLSNALVIVVEKESGAQIKDARDLAKPEVKQVALAEPSSVPAGVYAKAYLEKVGLWAAISAKVVPTENVRAALAAVESGNVEVGFVFKTDAAISKRVRVAYEVTAAEGPKISYPVAVVRASEHAEAARHFIAYLSGGEAKAEFEKFGFIVLP
jgi:molybdate transport system substrate-binding protein